MRPRMAFARVMLALCALVFAGVGAAFLIAPVPMAATIGIALPESSAITDFRATDGGFQLGMAAFLAWCLMAPARVQAGLVGAALGIAGFAGGRLVGILIDGTSRPILYAVLVAELAGVALTTAALVMLPRSDRR